MRTSVLLPFIVAMGVAVRGMPISEPERKYIWSETERALPFWVGTGAGLGATAGAGELWLMPATLAAGGGAGAAMAGLQGVILGTYKRLTNAPCTAETSGDGAITRLNDGANGAAGGAAGGASTATVAAPPFLSWNPKLRALGGALGAEVGLLAAAGTGTVLSKLDPYNGACDRPEPPQADTSNGPEPEPQKADTSNGPGPESPNADMLGGP